MDLHAQLEATWAHISTTYKPGMIEFMGAVFTQVVGFIFPATIYLMIDFLFPKFSRRHKIQGDRRQPTQQQVRHYVIVYLSNHLWIAALHFAALYTNGFDHSHLDMTPTMPSFHTLVVAFLFGLLAREILFYYVHRAFHHPSIYVYIHKMHHKYITPVAFAAEYAHPVEHLFANVLPVTLPLYLKRTHFLSFLTFGIFELWKPRRTIAGMIF